MDRVATAIGCQCGTIAACGLASPALVVLVGPSGAGKSTWAEAAFAAGEIVSSDRLRAVVGEAEDDLAASADAFALLDAIVAARLRRGLTAVVDTLGLDADATARVGGAGGAARRAGGGAWCSTRRRRRAARGTAARPRPVPGRCWPTSSGKFRAREGSSTGEGFAEVHGVVPEPPRCRRAASRRRVRRRAGAAGGRGCGSGCSLSRFDWPGGAAGLRNGIRQVRRGRGGGRLRVDLADGPRPSDPAGRPRRGRTCPRR